MTLYSQCSSFLDLFVKNFLKAVGILELEHLKYITVIIGPHHNAATRMHR